jgi:Resolvase, N terminal domain
MMGVFAEFERAMIAERVRSGLARARGEGKRLGRPPIAPTLEKRIREALAAPGGPVCASLPNSLESILGQCSASAALFAAASVAVG